MRGTFVILLENPLFLTPMHMVGVSDHGFETVEFWVPWLARASSCVVRKLHSRTKMKSARYICDFIGEPTLSNPNAHGWGVRVWI